MTAPEITSTFLPAPGLPPGRANLVITGFMGTGKSTAGKEAANLLGFPFVDLDRLIEQRTGRIVQELFDEEGEDAFRALERTALKDAARLSGTVLATGGGAVLHDREFAELKRTGEVVVLTADPAVMTARVRAGEGRPMLGDQRPVEQRVRKLFEERADRYAAAGSPVDTTHGIRKSAAREAVALYARHTGADGTIARFEVPNPGPHTSSVLIGRGATDHVARELCAALPRCVLAVVAAEEAVAGPNGVAERIGATLDGAGIRCVRVTVAGGERRKDLATATALWDAFREAGLSRTDAVVAVGGGATLDAVGFAAATYARGVPLINVPTTLLSMVDASLGGKVGIDHGATKNLVGAFHHPAVVIADPESLATLPAEIVRHGLAEAVKAAVLASPAALDAIDQDRLDTRGLPVHLEWVVEQAVRIKAAYVAADPEDRGIRHSLNLGHTFAHAIESASGYEIAHGDAVAIGTVAAARLGERFGLTAAHTSSRLQATFDRLGLPTVAPTDLDVEAMAAAMRSDKKRRAGRSVFVVPADGGAALLEGVDPRDALLALAEGGEP
jgi:3-dehydroquinate synthase